MCDDCQSVKGRGRLPGMTNEAIAERIGISHSGVSRIRTGGRVPLRETMLAIEREFGWTLEQQSRAAAEGRYSAEFENRVVLVVPSADPA